MHARNNMVPRKLSVAIIFGWLVGLLGLLLQDAKQAYADQGNRPNILWITIEDWSPDLSCYGTPGIQTPHVDNLVAQGVRYNRAFTTSPVCSTSRSAMMTGFHQNYIGAHQHRTADKKPLPYGMAFGRSHICWPVWGISRA